mmetsp:Transcript_33713/g.108357  ORF Transcript_33713/g.108357 Transcript_33713/m.108357 type:complete len:218 (+) Transcript_33713:1118-1771(+)
MYAPTALAGRPRRPLARRRHRRLAAAKGRREGAPCGAAIPHLAVGVAAAAADRGRPRGRRARPLPRLGELGADGRRRRARRGRRLRLLPAAARRDAGGQALFRPHPLRRGHFQGAPHRTLLGAAARRLAHAVQRVRADALPARHCPLHVRGLEPRAGRGPGDGRGRRPCVGSRRRARVAGGQLCRLDDSRKRAGLSHPAHAVVWGERGGGARRRGAL